MDQAEWYGIANWDTSGRRYDDDGLVTLEYGEPASPAWASIATLRKRLGQRFADGSGTLPTSIADARRLAVAFGLTAISPNHWRDCPFDSDGFGQLCGRVFEEATDNGRWRPVALTVDEGALPAAGYELPYDAMAVAADAGTYFVAIGARAVRPPGLRLTLAGP